VINSDSNIRVLHARLQYLVGRRVDFYDMYARTLWTHGWRKKLVASLKICGDRVGGKLRPARPGGGGGRVQYWYGTRATVTVP